MSAQNNVFLSPKEDCSVIMGGLMSGTSLDGVDAVLVSFSYTAATGTYSQRLLAHSSLPMPIELRERIEAVVGGVALPVREISSLHASLAELYEESVREAVRSSSFSLNDITAIGLHGQTVWHSPPHKDGDELAHTLQIGAGTALATRLGVPVVHDFRTADIVLGGQGAPLVPMYDAVFLRQPEVHSVAVNIGGMANITLLPPTRDDSSPIIAFDTGPGNIFIDMAMRHYFGKLYDEGGTFAAVGRAIPRLLSTLAEEPFVRAAPPKSTGREYFSRGYFEAALVGNVFDFHPAEDVVRTFTAFTAWAIAENIRLYGKSSSKVVVAGGGAYNATLLGLLRAELPTAEICTSADIGIPPEAKEAMCFAFLALRRLQHLPGNLPSVTGASKSAVLGSVAL